MSMVQKRQGALARAAGVLEYCCPDWHGLVMPPLREDAKRDRELWETVYWPDPHSAENDEERWKIAALRVMMATLLAKKYGTDKVLTHSAITSSLEHTFKKTPYWDRPIYGKLDRVDLKKALEGAEEYMKVRPQYFPPEAIEDYKKLFPVALEAAKAVGKMLHRWARDVSRQKYNMASYEEPDTVWYGLEMLKAAAKGKGPTPHQYIPNYLTKEEIEKIHVAQRVLAELLGLHSRVMFEKGRKSGVDMFLDEKRMEELEQEVQRILRGEHLKGILGENPLSTWRPAAAKSEQKPITQKKEKFTIDDVDMSKVEKHPETGLPIVRNGDEIIVLPPHKHPKEIPDLHPEALSPHAASMAYYELIKKNNITDPEEFKKAVNIIIKIMEDYRKKIMEEGDVGKAELKIARSLDKYSDGSAAAEAAIKFMENALFLHGYHATAKIKGYTIDHALAELAPSEVQIRETKDLVADALKNPEKYGIKDFRDLLQLIYKAEKKIKGFPHKEHT